MKKRFKKVVEWKYNPSDFGSFGFVGLIIGGCIAITPLLFNIRINPYDDIAYGFTIFGGIGILIGIGWLISDLRREVYWEQK